MFQHNHYKELRWRLLRPVRPFRRRLPIRALSQGSTKHWAEERQKITKVLLLPEQESMVADDLHANWTLHQLVDTAHDYHSPRSAEEFDESSMAEVAAVVVKDQWKKRHQLTCSFRLVPACIHGYGFALPIPLGFATTGLWHLLELSTAKAAVAQPTTWHSNHAQVQ